MLLDRDDCNLNEITLFASRQQLVRATVQLGGQRDGYHWRVTMSASDSAAGLWSKGGPSNG